MTKEGLFNRIENFNNWFYGKIHLIINGRVVVGTAFFGGLWIGSFLTYFAQELLIAMVGLQVWFLAYILWLRSKSTDISQSKENTKEVEK